MKLDLALVDDPPAISRERNQLFYHKVVIGWRLFHGIYSRLVPTEDS